MVFKIYLNDIYCIYKVLEIFYVICMFLSEYFKVNFKKFFEYVIFLFVLFIEKSAFYNNIKWRIKNMFYLGFVEEIKVFYI